MSTIAPGTIDLHTHVYPRALDRWPAPAGDSRWPCMTCESETRATIARGGALYRVIDERCWDLERRLDDMGNDGVAFQLLSPTPVTFAYDSAPAATDAFARAHNEAIAAYVRERPASFAGLGTVALQDVDRACAEVERCRSELGLHGVEIGTIAGEWTIDDPRYDAFWATCERTNATVFVHPEATLAPERFARRRMVYSTGYPSETGTTAVALLLAGLFERHPALRVLLAHGGGTLPWLVARNDRVWGAFEDARDATTIAPSVAAKNFWLDSMVNDATNVRYLVDRLGADRLVVGSDYPFPIGEFPAGASVPDDLRERVRDNALRFLRG